MYIISIGFNLFERISLYLFYLNIIVFSYFVKQRSLRQLSICMALACFLFFGMQIFLARESHGAVPYRTIINKDLNNPPWEWYLEHIYDI
jgi:cytosine/uracil/thiamine/allantoin permease